jgi:hypothetical protein
MAISSNEEKLNTMVLQSLAADVETIKQFMMALSAAMVVSILLVLYKSCQ